MLDIKLTLRVFSDEFSFSELKEVLGEPTKGFSKGDFYSQGAKVREKSYWSLESPLHSTEKFELHLLKIIDFLENKKDDFFEIQKKCSIDLFCMLSSDNGQGGLMLPHFLAGKLSQYSLDIVFDVYADGD